MVRPCAPRPSSGRHRRIRGSGSGRAGGDCWAGAALALAAIVVVAVSSAETGGSKVVTPPRLSVCRLSRTRMSAPSCPGTQVVRPGDGVHPATQVRPNLVLYYSGWYEPFSGSFARAAAKNGAVPLVQINPPESDSRDRRRALRQLSEEPMRGLFMRIETP